MKKTIIIPVDHGNRLTKTRHFAFVSSFMESTHLPSIDGDTLIYNNNEYAISDQNKPPQNDKSEDERYFILTLFAIAMELTRDVEQFRFRPPQPNEIIEVNLLVGLPILHFKQFGEKFEQYFLNRGAIQFKFKDRTYTINITSAKAYYQGYAAALTVYSSLKDSRTVNAVDVGGHTVDLMQMINFKGNPATYDSLYWGVNALFKEINEKVRSLGKKNIPYDTIESILRKDESAIEEASAGRIELVHSTTRTFVDSMLQEIGQGGLDLVEDKTVFMGGGAILLKEYIMDSSRVRNPIFVDDVHANAKGYLLLNNAENQQAAKVTATG